MHCTGISSEAASGFALILSPPSVRGGGLVFNFQFLTRTQILSTAAATILPLQKVRRSTSSNIASANRQVSKKICHPVNISIFATLLSILKLWKNEQIFTSGQLALAMSSKNLHPWFHNEQTGQAPGSEQ